MLLESLLIGGGVDNLERWVKMLDETEIVFNDTNTFALKRVAD